MRRAATTAVGHPSPLPYAFVDRLKALPFVEAIWLFGSRARGTAGQRADIDIALVAPTATESEWQQALDIVEDADTLLRIDLVRFDALAPTDDLRANILRDRVALYQRVAP